MVAPHTNRFSSLNGLALQPSGGSCRISLRSVINRRRAADGADCDDMVRFPLSRSTDWLEVVRELCVRVARCGGGVLLMRLRPPKFKDVSRVEARTG